jgi:chaperone required for assembly of F1-ATPase
MICPLCNEEYRSLTDHLIYTCTHAAKFDDRQQTVHCPCGWWMSKKRSVRGSRVSALKGHLDQHRTVEEHLLAFLAEWQQDT